MTHLCVFTSGGNCTSPRNTNYTSCSVRCFGHGFTAQSTLKAQEPASQTIIDRDQNMGKWPEDGLVDLWVRPMNCSEMLSYGLQCTYSGPLMKTPSYNPQGFTFTYSGSGKKGFSDGASSVASFNVPEDIVVDKYGYILVADTGNNAIRKILLDGSVVTLAGKGPTNQGYVDGDCSIATFHHPKGIDATYVIDSSTNTEVMIIVIADTSNHRIRMIRYDNSTNSCMVSCLSGLCGNNTLSFSENKFRAYPIAGYADGPGLTSRFSAPESVVIFDNNTIIVADTGNFLLRQLDMNGYAYTLAGSLTNGQTEADGSPLAGCPPPCMVGVQGFRDGNLTHAQFYNPLDVTLGPNNTIFIADEHRIRMLSFSNVNTTLQTIQTQGNVVTIAGNTLQGHDDGRADESTFFEPSGVYVTSDTIAYVTDRASCRIRRITPLPLVSQGLTCSTNAQSLVRPSGCTSFEQILDKTGLKISRVEANIQYNYGDPYRSDPDWGKRPKNCVGSPPPDRLDKRFISDGDNLVVDDHQTIINVYFLLLIYSMPNKKIKFNINYLFFPNIYFSGG